MIGIQKRRRSALVALVCAGIVGVSLGVLPASADSASEEVVTVVHSDPANPSEARSTYLGLMEIPSSDTGYLPVDGAPMVEGPLACPPSRCHDYLVPIPADLKVTSSMVRVLLPQGYKKSKKRYPVVYLYNGARSPYTRWSIGTQLTSITSKMKAIFVMPEGGIGDEAGMFSDWIDGSYDWETFHTEVLTSWVDRRFRTVPGARAAIGASMGSLGALDYAARHPGLFTAVLSISGAVDTNMMVGNILPPEIEKSLGISPPDLRRVWGNPVLDRANWDAHNPVALAPKLAGTYLLITAGTGSSSTTSTDSEPLHSGYVEQLMWTGHRSFLAALTNAGVPFTARIRQGGVHDWPYFDTPLRWGLPKLLAHIRPHVS